MTNQLAAPAAPNARPAAQKLSTPPAGAGLWASATPTLVIEVGVAKLSKYAVRESGDTVEVTERPHGGISVVLADGQGSGRAAKTTSNLVAKKALSLLADGTRDGATARATHDFLFAYRHGQVSAELAIVSADLLTKSIVISRNTHCPALLVHDGQVEVWDQACAPIGLYPNTKPAIRELPLLAGTVAIAYSDGIYEAGRRRGLRFDVVAAIHDLPAERAAAQAIADALLAGALAVDEGRAGDDMTVVVLALREHAHSDGARRLSMAIPLP
jgi:serine phosphatase RsbU (regulator of sigma subunit)